MNKTWHRLFVCLHLFVKRLLTRTSFILILCLLPLLSMGLKYLLNNTQISIRVGLFSEDKGEAASQITKRLISNSQGITFVEFSTEDEMLDSIRTRSYECGFIFPENFSEQIAAGETDDLVNLYVSPGTSVAAIASEYIFSEIFALYAFEELMDFIETRPYFSFVPKELISLRSQLQPIYENYLSGDDTFSFEYVTPEKNIMDTSIVLSDYILSSATGIAALFILIGAFSGTIHLYKDSRKGIFYAFPANTRTLCKLADIFSGAFLTALGGLFTIIICNGVHQLQAVLLNLIFYTVLCTLYCYLLYRLIPSANVFSALIPVLIMGCIIFCPIFFDFSPILPVVKYLKWLFPPGYLC